MSRKRKAAEPTAVARPWPGDAGRLRRLPQVWFNLVAGLLPVILLTYGLTALSVAWVNAAHRHPRAWGSPLSPGNLLVVGLWLLGSGLGQAWTAAVVLLRQTGVPPTRPRVLALLRARLGALATAWLARALVVYAPLLALAAWAATMAHRQASFGTNPSVLLTLLVGSLAVNCAIMTALLVPVVLAEPGLGLVGALQQARERGYGSPGPLVLGGLLWLLAMWASVLPLWGVRHLVPNHLVGSLIWVLLPLAYVRARRAAEPDWSPDDLARALAVQTVE